ncbi:type VI secretion system-associated protein VasI [Litchfieldella anticariensis]|nr:type VI secretion system-associated protein VasI [Halomonas anticariensis]
MSPMFVIRPMIAMTLVIGLGLTSAASQADSAASVVERAQACAERQSRLERLECYDALFRFSSDGNGVSVDDPLPALWHAIQAQERTRHGEDFGFLVGERGGDVLMSAPALGTTPPRPRLVIACEKAITRFQLHLPEASSEPRTRLHLIGAGRELTQEWRIRDGGHVVSGGRGLPAIATLRQLLDAQELTLSSDLEVLDGLRFDLTGLRQKIQPLRDTCRW